MREYVGEAIVLHKDLQGELDERVVFFAKEFGKQSAKIKSGRKITSKLSPHLEPGNLIRARWIENGNLQVVDALKRERLDFSPGFLKLLCDILAEHNHDEELWNFLRDGKESSAELLTILGWSPKGALCQVCSSAPHLFGVESLGYYCADCGFKVRGNKIYINELV